METIKQQCKVRGMGFTTWNQSKHCIIPVDCTWDEFQQKKGRRRIIRQIECKLDQIDTWNIEYTENVDSRPEILEKILDIERRSWKQSSSNSLRARNVEELLMIWKDHRLKPILTQILNTVFGF